ncbi:family 20 glycosylhydrolase [uncultured Paludibaculum sp.]|uniref:family 20 glycosylhydrolase n=1 Tax=uncultured Paludibaculum sp. TaxID=1765020 RepID=UPI002AAB7B06|nr:family 20 glycosylhydrolase [uncultured Paludibaculum sp.]
MLRSLLLLTVLLGAQAAPLPVRGIHLGAPTPEEMPLATRFIEEALPKEGVNVLILEINYHYQYAKHPEVVDPDALSAAQLRQLAESCRKAQVRLIPMINLLGHQSWAKTTFGLLRGHPEFDETPKKYPDNEGIYCRSYCPRHPKAHAVLFDLIDELMDVTGADTFHAGMDEVFLLGEKECKRCRGRNRAELFANEVKTLHAHLAKQNKELWIWGDRLIDGNVTGIGKWEASQNETAPALSLIPKDVVIADWHYEAPHATGTYFALSGFRVVTSPWRKTPVALGQLAQIRDARAHSTKQVAGRMLGMLQTTWVGFGPFVRAYFQEGDTPKAQVTEAVACFRSLFAELRTMN